MRIRGRPQCKASLAFIPAPFLCLSIQRLLRALTILFHGYPLGILPLLCLLQIWSYFLVVEWRSRGSIVFNWKFYVQSRTFSTVGGVGWLGEVILRLEVHGNNTLFCEYRLSERILPLPAIHSYTSVGYSIPRMKIFQLR